MHAEIKNNFFGGQSYTSVYMFFFISIPSLIFDEKLMLSIMPSLNLHYEQNFFFEFNQSSRINAFAHEL